MPKNKGKGGKGYRSGKKYKESAKRELITKTEGLDYGIIKNVLGGAKVLVKCMGSNEEILGHIRGPIYKREWLSKDDVVLVSLRDFEPGKCDIVWKYNQEEIRLLQKQNQISKLSSDEKIGGDLVAKEMDVEFEEAIESSDTVDLDDFIDAI
jgi:translation initiation factor 1A